MSGLLFIISAPSGSGKSTLVNELRKVVPGLEFSVSYTTRTPRGSERHGTEYFFVGRAEFERMIVADAFLEHADVFGNYYGTARHFLEDAGNRGHDLILDIDVQGAAQVKQKKSDAVSIFILPPDRKTLAWRLSHRAQDEEKEIRRRLAEARGEIENYRQYDYILVNDRLEESTEALKAIVEAERRRRERPPYQSANLEDAALMARANSSLREKMDERVQLILASFADGE